MIRSLALLALLWALLAPGLASAEAWRSCPGDETATANFTTSLSTGQHRCYRTDTTTDPARINALSCAGGLDIWFNALLTATADDGTTGASVEVYWCADMDGTTTADCERLLVDVDPDTDAAVDSVSMNGHVEGHRAFILGAPPQFYFFDITNADPDLAELRIVCR